MDIKTWKVYVPMVKKENGESMPEQIDKNLRESDSK